MRGARAKMLRRIADEMTVGMPVVQYQETALNPHKPTRRSRLLYACTRLAYRNLKGRYKAGFSR